MILRAVSDSTPPPDLTVSLTLTGGKLLEPIILERKAEDALPLPPPCSNRPQAYSSQGSKSHEENKTSNSDKELNLKLNLLNHLKTVVLVYMQTLIQPLSRDAHYLTHLLLYKVEQSLHQKGTCVHAKF